jgi:hypothetical protein
MDIKRKRTSSLEVDLPGSGWGPVVGCFELDNELSGCVMCMEFIDRQLLGKDYAEYSWLV